MAAAGGRAVLLSQPGRFVTGNAKKFAQSSETRSPFAQLNSIVRCVPELQGEPEDISKEKARLAAKEVNGPVLVEDTCLFFNMLSRVYQGHACECHDYPSIKQVVFAED